MINYLVIKNHHLRNQIMSMRNLLRMIPYILNINNDYYTNVKKKEEKNYDGIYLNDGQKRELRRYLFTIKSDWIKGVKNWKRNI